MPPPVTADLRPCADGSAVHTALVSAGQLWPAVQPGQLGQTDGWIVALVISYVTNVNSG